MRPLCRVFLSRNRGQSLNRDSSQPLLGVVFEVVWGQSLNQAYAFPSEWWVFVDGVARIPAFLMLRAFAPSIYFAVRDRFDSMQCREDLARTNLARSPGMRISQITQAIEL
jgi:hypothetical protein